MELYELRVLGETRQPKSNTVESIFCRHRVEVRRYSMAYGSEDVEPGCPQCRVEMEILERLDRIEKMHSRKVVASVVDVSAQFVVRHYDASDNCWTDWTGPLSKKEAQDKWNELTKGGTEQANYGYGAGFDYFKIFPASRCQGS